MCCGLAPLPSTNSQRRVSFADSTSSASASSLSPLCLAAAAAHAGWGASGTDAIHSCLPLPHLRGTRATDVPRTVDATLRTIEEHACGGTRYGGGGGRGSGSGSGSGSMHDGGCGLMALQRDLLRRLRQDAERFPPAIVTTAQRRELRRLVRAAKQDSSRSITSSSSSSSNSAQIELVAARDDKAAAFGGERSAEDDRCSSGLATIDVDGLSPS